MKRRKTQSQQNITILRSFFLVCITKGKIAFFHALLLFELGENILLIHLVGASHGTLLINGRLDQISQNLFHYALN